MSSHEPESLIFILGCQRSGTTWLANIFDSSPDTLLFMEPFAPAYGIFPEFPEMSLFLDQGHEHLVNLLEGEFINRISKNKSLLFYRSRTEPSLFRMERMLASLTKRTFRLLPQFLVSRIQAFQLLNLNRLDSQFPIPRKSSHPSRWIVKELRLAGKIPILLNAFPQAHYIVIMRHPAATVHSILKLFNQGGLRELRSEVDQFVEKIAIQPISEAYADLIPSCLEGNLARKLALYWRVSYETLYRQLEMSGEHTLVVYEALASDPLGTASQLFARVGVPFSLPVEEYISKSSTKEPATITSLTTVRNSKHFYLSWENEIDPQMLREVMTIAEESFLMPYFSPYY